MLSCCHNLGAVLLASGRRTAIAQARPLLRAAAKPSLPVHPRRSLHDDSVVVRASKQPAGPWGPPQDGRSTASQGGELPGAWVVGVRDANHAAGPAVSVSRASACTAIHSGSSQAPLAPLPLPWHLGWDSSLHANLNAVLAARPVQGPVTEAPTPLPTQAPSWPSPPVRLRLLATRPRRPSTVAMAHVSSRGGRGGRKRSLHTWVFVNAQRTCLYGN